MKYLGILLTIGIGLSCTEIYAMQRQTDSQPTPSCCIFKNESCSPHQAAARDCLSCLASFIVRVQKNTIDINIKSITGLSPLHCAISSGQIRAAFLLIAAGANKNEKSQDPNFLGYTPLCLGIMNNKHHVIEFLLRYDVLLDNAYEVAEKYKFDLEELIKRLEREKNKTFKEREAQCSLLQKPSVEKEVQTVERLFKESSIQTAMTGDNQWYLPDDADQEIDDD